MSDAGAVAFAFDGATAAASIVCFVVAVLANAGGVGGGGVFVPLLMLVVGLGGKWVIPVSNAMILAGAIPAVAINLCKRHPCHNRPLLDVDIALLLVPATLGGTTPGVLLNVMFPDVLLRVMPTGTKKGEAASVQLSEDFAVQNFTLDSIAEYTGVEED